MLAAVLAVGAGASPAAAHGGADWIMNHPDFGWCCGPKDCFWMEPEEVRVEGGHYIVDRFAIRWSVVGSFPSADRRYWACYYMKGTDHQRIKCFFAPKPLAEIAPARPLSTGLSARGRGDAGRTSSSAHPS